MTLTGEELDGLESEIAHAICNGGHIHLTCSFPICTCKATGAQTKAVLNAPALLSMATRVGPLETALDLALALLAPSEPPDSRAISSEYVAMACVAAGKDNEESHAIIRAALARLAMAGGTAK